MDVLKRDFLPGDLEPELRRAGFEGCVAVQARQTLEETRWLLELADRNPFIVGVVGWVDLCSPEAAVQLDGFAGHPARRRPTRRPERARRRASWLREDFLPRDRAPRRPRTHLRHPHLPTPSQGRRGVRGALPPAALRARPPAKPEIRSGRDRRVGPGPAGPRRRSPRAVQALGPGDGGGLGGLDSGGNPALPGRRLRLLRPRAAHDRLGLAGLHPGRRLRPHDATRDGLPGPTPGRGAGSHAAAATPRVSGSSLPRRQGNDPAFPESRHPGRLRPAVRSRRRRLWRRRQERAGAPHDRGHPQGHVARLLAEHPRGRGARPPPRLGVEIIWRGPAARRRPRRPGRPRSRASSSRGVSGIVLAPLDETALVAPVAGGEAQRHPRRRDHRLRAQGRRLRQLRGHRQPEGRAPGRRAARGAARRARARSCSCATRRAPTARTSARRASSTR